MISRCLCAYLGRHGDDFSSGMVAVLFFFSKSGFLGRGLLPNWEVGSVKKKTLARLYRSPRPWDLLPRWCRSYGSPPGNWTIQILPEMSASGRSSSSGDRLWSVRPVQTFSKKYIYTYILNVPVVVFFVRVGASVFFFFLVLKSLEGSPARIIGIYLLIGLGGRRYTQSEEW